MLSSDLPEIDEEVDEARRIVTRVPVRIRAGVRRVVSARLTAAGIECVGHRNTRCPGLVFAGVVEGTIQERLRVHGSLSRVVDVREIAALNRHVRTNSPAT